MSAIAKEGPSAGDVHVDAPLGEKAGARRRKPHPDADVEACLAKLDASSLYVHRQLLNAADLIKWAKANGFATTIPADDMHVTVVYSRAPVDWLAMGDSWSGDEKGNLTVRAGGPRKMERFGPTGDAVVLVFYSSDLKWRHDSMVEAGCSDEWGAYNPHVTISWDAPGVDVETLEPYQGELKFGPEIFQPVKEDWRNQLVEKSFSTFFKAAGVNEELGLVFGWGIICKEGGVQYRDTQGNEIPEDAMVVATTDFMKSARVHGDMHVRGTGPELPAGVVVHSFPLTTEIAKAMGITSDKTGWMIATAPDAAMLAKFKSGEYTGFSIGGEHIEVNGKPVAGA